MPSTIGWTLQDWRQAYLDREQTPARLLQELRNSLSADDIAWISLATPAQLNDGLAKLDRVLAQAGGDPAALPLFGVPFAIKDNIDAVGFETTAGCPDYTYSPDEDAAVVAKLRAAGAVLIGKTNLDQFATGLVGTRSPYGEVPNTFDPKVISGGSSSGSASVVARGLVPFALGTDTAGSGRVPAGLNNLVGLKPTRGAISIEGVVPACRSLDCVSIFALTIGDAGEVYEQAAVYQPSDAFSRQKPDTLPAAAPAIRQPGEIKRLAVPAEPDWFGDDCAKEAWGVSQGLWEKLGVTLVPTDFSLLSELAALLYEGPWVAERHAAVEDFMAAHPGSMNPVVRGIIGKAANFNATDTFKAQYRREELVRAIDHLLEDIDALLVPTAPIAPSIAAVNADPVTLNSRLGTYTNFVNLADLCALAVPAGFRSDALPFGVTLIAGAWRDSDLQQLASRWLNANPTCLGATDRPRPKEGKTESCVMSCSPISSSLGDTITVAVVGAHLTDMPLNTQLTDRNAVLMEQTTTSPNYRLFALPDTSPPKPGLKRVSGDDEGKAIVLEVWEVAATAFGSFVDLIPPPLGIGNVELADGRWVNSFICEGYALENARDVTEFGGWRAYIDAFKTGKA